MSAGIRLSHPLPGGRETDPFGWRPGIPGVVGPQLHTGQDYAAPMGTPILAAQDGQVRAVWFDQFPSGAGAGGNMVSIADARVETRYAHMDAPSPLTPGQWVRAGDIVGYVGTSGASTGPHLHFEALINGQFVNPVAYIGASLPPKQKATPEEEDIMAKTAGFAYKVAGRQINVLVNPVSGFYHEYEANDGGYNSGIARAFQTGSFEQISESHARKLHADCAAVRDAARR